MALGQTRINGQDFTLSGRKEAAQNTIARFGDVYYDVRTGLPLVTIEFVRFVESTYEEHPKPSYNLLTDMKDSAAAYGPKFKRKSINISTDLVHGNGFKHLDKEETTLEQMSYFCMCKRRWPRCYFQLTIPTTFRLDPTPILPWIAISDGMFIRSLRWPTVVTATNLPAGKYEVWWDDEKGPQATPL